MRKKTMKLVITFHTTTQEALHGKFGQILSSYFSFSFLRLFLFPVKYTNISHSLPILHPAEESDVPEVLPFNLSKKPMFFYPSLSLKACPFEYTTHSYKRRSGYTIKFQT